MVNFFWKSEVNVLGKAYKRANMEKCISIALTTQDSAKMELLLGMASLAGTFFFIYSTIYINNFLM